MSRLCAAIAVLLALPGTAAGQALLDRSFSVAADGEAVAAITASCNGCNWGVPGREAAALELTLDGAYSQHVLLTRGAEPAVYRVMLGALAGGLHRLTIARDPALSARDAGEARVHSVDIEWFSRNAGEYPWLSTAPRLHARPGTVERFTDVPLMMYAEANPGQADGYRYTVIFSHEDGGTPTDRLMATWGRSTDIEFVYGYGSGAGPSGEYQGIEHEIFPFRGKREGLHPILWVSTDNNMFSDSGPDRAVRFAPAPELVSLENVSRETVMDAHPWLYEVMSAELMREGRIDAGAVPGSGKIPDPRRFAYLEACGELDGATLAFDIGVGSGSDVAWYPTDRGDARFRIARDGCFRAAVPLREGVTPAELAGVRARAYTRPPREGDAPLPPGTGRVLLRRLNAVFMLREDYVPAPSNLRWTGVVELRGESAAVAIPIGAR